MNEYRNIIIPINKKEAGKTKKKIILFFPSSLLFYLRYFKFCFPWFKLYFF